jgi:streptogramin lyase
MRKAACLMTAVASVVIAGCGPRGAAPVSSAAQGAAFLATPQVIQRGRQPLNWVQFVPQTTSTNLYGIVVGPDGNMWFTDSTASGGLVRMSMTGSVKELSLGGSAFAPYTLSVATAISI